MPSLDSLGNMRYKSCTDEDVALLRSRIAGQGASKQVYQHQHSDISVSSQHSNAHRDKVNEQVPENLHSDMCTTSHPFLLTG